MSEFIPSYNFTEFKKLRPEQLKRLKSAEITFNGEYIFSFVRPQTDYIKASVESLGQLGNAIGGETLEEIQSALV